VYEGTVRVHARPGTFDGGDELTLDVLRALTRPLEIRLQTRGQTFGLELLVPGSDPAVTQFTLSQPYQSSIGLVGQCTRCVPWSAGAPTRVAFEATAYGGIGRHIPSAAGGTLQVSLTRVAPSSLSLEQLERLGDRDLVRSLRAEAGGYVRDVSGTLPPTSASRAPQRCTCSELVAYEGRWWIDAADPGRFELRNARVTGLVTQCRVPQPVTHGCGGSSWLTAERREPL
jgi:hypothetical protein